ncbi:hypothetical protein [uncultured Dialister sp.]|jgi:tRNA A-37 threonylcarbamoyl transferase component Bud32|uniref:hypothetical protein n=1 Tax=uncultured Dialister sp. TaxID=278064 RepID=UPI0025D4E983|nr:hypothetical protein [uncultured Dialister sp.]
MDEYKTQRLAEAVIRENPSRRILDFSMDGEKYWIKRKLGNGRNQLVKYSVEKEFYYEIARITIAGEKHPELVPKIVLLEPSYMVTLDGGPTLKNILTSKRSEEEKEDILEQTGAALAALHRDGIIHGRPALRDITCRDGKLTFLDWENRLYVKSPEEQRAVDFLLLLQGIYRENFDEEKGRIEALERGYFENGGKETIEEARRFLSRHRIIGSMTHFLSPFRMKDIESVRKLYDHFA